jgi:hypothetical protein
MSDIGRMVSVGWRLVGLSLHPRNKAQKSDNNGNARAPTVIAILMSHAPITAVFFFRRWSPIAVIGAASMSRSMQSIAMNAPTNMTM